MTGKEKCAILREIRKLIASENGIPYEFKECTHEGDCKGYCKKCDEEIKYIGDIITSNISKKDKWIVFPALLKGKFVFDGEETISLAEALEAPSSNRIGMMEDFAKPTEDKLRQILIGDLDFSIRTYTCLIRANIFSVGDLIEKTEDDMLKIRNLGKKSIDEIVYKLKAYGLSLKDKND